MTHSELLAMFDDYEAHFDQVKDEPKVFAMLHAVVKLHKPWNFGCSHCINIEGGYMSYPCPTIQIIERELQ